MCSQWPSSGSGSTVETLIATSGVVSSEASLCGFVFFLRLLLSFGFLSSFFAFGLLGARSLAVKSAGVGYWNASLILAALSSSAAFGGGRSFGSSFTSSTLTMPLSIREIPSAVVLGRIHLREQRAGRIVERSSSAPRAT